VQITTIFDIAEDFRTGINLATARRSLTQALRRVEEKQTEQVRDAQSIFLIQAHTFEEGFERMREVVQATDSLPDLHELLAQQTALEQRLRAHSQQALTAARAIDQLVKADLPEALVSPELAEIAAVARGAPTGLGLESLVTALLKPARKPSLARARIRLRRLHRSRLRYLHRGLLARIAATPQSAAEGTHEAPSPTEFAKVGRDLRVAAKRMADEMARETLLPAMILETWQALARWERWLESDGTRTLTATLACAGGEGTDAFRWARAGAHLYDEVRRGFAYSAALREGLIAVALHDSKALGRFANASHLPLGSTQLDLSRTSLSALRSGERETLVEIDGRITRAEFQPGGPEPRSALELTDQAGARANVVVPYASIDSFGIEEGVWMQVRGRLFLEGKYDVPGPLVQVRRLEREEASHASFSDFLTWTGRHLFEMRPGGYDLVAGRVSGSLNAVNEHVVRPGVPEDHS